jgi:hypothetical protein
MEVGGQGHTTAALFREREPVTSVKEAGWAQGQSADAEHLSLHRDSTPGPSGP